MHHTLNTLSYPRIYDLIKFLHYKTLHEFIMARIMAYITVFKVKFGPINLPKPKEKNR